MSRKKSKLLAVLLSAGMCIGTQASVFAVETNKTVNTLDASSIETMGGITISNDKISTNNYKNEKYNNPVSSEFFCADPTAVEYNGRLYLIGTNDHQQFEVKGPDVDNTYEQIKSMLILSTDDMVNWTYHGEINIGEIAPWITNSWAPTMTSRVEEDGKTHFYLYFSNNGLGVGVIHTTDLLGTWDDPLGQPLISTSTPGLTDCPNPFDPGVVIDDNGDGWLAFGAGMASDGTAYMPGSARIVKLGDDMVSFDSEFVEIPAPYLFEASELNYINGTYVYTYNSDWSDHSEQWDYDCPVPSQCSMVYMTTKTPLDPDSWEMKGECFINPGTAGFDYSNNHTHMHKFNGKWYMFYHTLMLKNGMGINGSYRSLNVDEITVDEETVTIEKTGGTKKGVDSIVSVDPFTVNPASELNNTADISFDTSDMSNPKVISDGEGSWISVRDVEFTESTETEEPETPAEFSLTAIDTITYNITVKSVDKDTTVSMHPSTKAGVDCTGSVDVTGTGEYSITCDLNGTEQLQNLGYFTATDDAQITFMIDTMVINDKYTFDMSTELTNTREWADGLKNIWNGFADGDKVYTSDFAEFVYNGTDEAIELLASVVTDDGNSNDSAPLVEKPMTFSANVKGTGRIEVRLDSSTGELLSSIDFDSPDKYQTIYNTEVTQIGGTHDLYFVFSNSDISLNSWQFSTSDTTEPTETTTTATETTVSSETVTTTVTDTDTSALKLGDANCDGKVNISDVVAVSAYVSNATKNPLEPQGIINADVQERGNSLNANDALMIQQFTTGVIESL